MAMSPLVMYTVFDRPRDFPQCFVIRRFFITGAPEPEPDTIAYAVGPTLDCVRRQLPAGLYRIPRQPEDEPQIVETWI
jgi:hypothetical protein